MADKRRVDEDEVNDEYELKWLSTAEEHICAPAGTNSEEEMYSKNDCLCWKRSYKNL